MPIIRTPEERFDNLSDFPFTPKYIEVNGMRVHYIDEGQGEIILCLHGEPTWSYLYRKMIPIFTKAGYRVIAPDFIGFGRSDKFTTLEEYTFQMFKNMLIGFIKILDLNQINVVVQDWGGLIGLRVVSEVPNRFFRLVIMNTGLPAGRNITDAFISWREYVKNTPDLPVGRVIGIGLVNRDILTPDIIKAYEAPFPDETYKAGAIAWPLLVPIHPNDPVVTEMLQARDNMKKWEKPALIMFSDGDPITRGGDQFFQNLIPSAKKQPEIIIKGAGHFLQEEKGEEIAKHILEFISRSPFQANI
ncbi:MAG: haloalkane dehalogenase [Candidatus Hodarchaeales archaeon]|jgi:haloalkane dehalogenase